MLHIEERGSGIPIVLLHGTPTTPAHLRPLAERLARGTRTLLVHLPGYGSSPPLIPYDIERAHAAVEEALLARGAAEAHFIGHSGGAYRAFALATRGIVRPRTITGLSALARLSPTMQGSFVAFAAMLRRGDDVADAVEALMLSPRARQDPAWVSDVRGWATASPAAHLADELEAFARAPDLRGDLALLDAPILLRVGALDEATPPPRSEEIAAVARHASLQVVADVGHALLLEDFDATAAAVERHLLNHS